MSRFGGKGPVIAVTLMAAVTAFAVTALLMNISERKQEARQTTFRVVELTEDTVDPAIWGRNYPYQHDGYKKTVDMVRTGHGGSEAIPKDPSPDDPRIVVAQEKLAVLPQLKRMW